MKRNSEQFSDGDANTKIVMEDSWKKGNARKSRITDSFVTAKELIDKELNGKWLSFDRSVYQFQVLYFFGLNSWLKRFLEDCTFKRIAGYTIGVGGNFNIGHCPYKGKKI